MPKTLFQQIWDEHIVEKGDNGEDLLYVDLHLCHEVTSPQAFEGLRLASREVRRPEKTVAVQDHCVPTVDRVLSVIRQKDAVAAQQIETLQKNCREFGIKLYDIDDPEQGVIHCVFPEQRRIHPGMTVVCGDSHTATHGAFGALAFGIGTSEVEHVLVTQTIRQKMPLQFNIHGENPLPKNCSAKDLILYIIGQLTVSGGTGCAVEFTGQPFTDLSMEGRMTVCNMSIEFGAKSGLIAADDVTFRYLADGFHCRYDAENATFDKRWVFDASKIEPMATWGTNPGQVAFCTGRIPLLDSYTDPVQRKAAESALKYMNLREGMNIADIKIQKVFIGSCTNGRIEDLRAAAEVLRGRKVADGVSGIVVPGSGTIKRQAESEGLDKIFTAAGLEWRLPGCSMCLGMNPDLLNAGEHCASTSNRNFEGRQGKGSCTHLVSPATAAIAAINGRLGS